MDLIPLSKNNVVYTVLGALTLYGIYWIYRNVDSSGDEEQGEPNRNIKRPAGIINEGNTCFVNSLLQALSSIELFNRNLEQLLKEKDQWKAEEQLLNELYNVITRINTNNENQSIEVLNFLQMINGLSNNMINFEQQDAHQLFAVLTHSIEQVFNRRKNVSLSRSVFNTNESVESLMDGSIKQPEKHNQNYLQGYLKSSITCTGCKTQNKIKIDGFYDLSLQIQPQSVNNLNSALRWFQRPQFIENWTCTQCSVNSHIQKLNRASAQLSSPNKQTLEDICNDFINYFRHFSCGDHQLSEINARFGVYVTKYKQIYERIGKQDPQIRKIFVEVQAQRRKIIKQTEITKYPKVLVIHFKQLCFDPYSGEPFLLRKRIEFERQFSVKIRKNSEKKQGQRKYSLTSLLTHVGNESMGHYFTYRKANKKENQWYLISDSISRQCRDNDLLRNIPYMLFYDSQDQ